ncbi:MMPL family transporter [Hirschia baltica]|uniref:Putative lipoprotein transmembrane n=1 Tax=Hirschia baltica (strain ATCC 49814 / DSM 5838 / IFAM 1418) TaxID=582402 RepID=C6XIP3_HIRBI|nr:putative lipoprotein transmembrane [Hirschia baltica ATCC 49814]
MLLGGKIRIGAVLCAIWLVASLIFIAVRFSSGAPIDTNIQSILPNNSLAPAVKAAMTQSGEVAANRVVFLISDVGETGKNAAAADDLKQRLLSADLFISDDADHEELGRWIFANRNEILCEHADEFGEETAQSIRNQALARVYGVGSPITGGLLQSDPFLLTLRLADCLSQGAAKVDAHQTLMTGKLNQSAYRMDTQEKLQSIVSEWEDEWLKQNLTLARTGAVFHANHGANSAKAEMSFIGGLGLLGVVALFGFVFGRMSNVFIVASLIILSCASGLAATLLVFSQIHMLVLVFAAMLVGVVADYAVHAMASGVGNGWPDMQQRKTHLWRPMTVSMLTTAAGFTGLMFLGVPMFRQLAVFAVTGVFTAWALVLFIFLPFDKPPHKNEDALRLRWMRALALSMKLLPVSKNAALLASIIILLSSIGFIFAKPLDDVRQYQPRNEELMKQEKQLNEVVGSVSSQVFLVSQGDDLEEAKQNEEAYLDNLSAQLKEKSPEPASNLALTRFDPSNQRREVNRQKLDEFLEKPLGKLQRAQLGLKATQAIEDVTADKPSWLSDLYVEANDKVYLIARLSGGIDYPSSENAIVVDTANAYSHAFASYRKLAARSLMIAVCVALVFVFIVYRKSGALSVVIAPACAMLCGIYLPALFGMPITFFSMAGAMVLFGVGVDYSAFMWEAGRSKEAWTKASVLVGTVTTLLSMGLLALSDTLPVRSFGITVAVGVICALIFSTLPYYLAQKEALNAK